MTSKMEMSINFTLGALLSTCSMRLIHGNLWQAWRLLTISEKGAGRGLPFKILQRVDFQIVMAYMALLAEGGRVIRVKALCDELSVSRTTFYNNFESIQDLDHRFLETYASLTMGDAPAGFPSVALLKAFYRSITESMQHNQPFFQGIFKKPWLHVYRIRWFEIIESRLLHAFRQEEDFPDKELWSIYVDFAIGLLRRFQEVSLRKTGKDLESHVQYLLEFLWSGYRRFRELAGGLPPPSQEEYDRLMANRHQKLERGR